MPQIRSCHACEDRKVGCHAICDKYKTEKQKNDELKNKIFLARQKELDLLNPRMRYKRANKLFQT